MKEPNDTDRDVSVTDTRRVGGDGAVSVDSEDNDATAAGLAKWICLGSSTRSRPTDGENVQTSKLQMRRADGTDGDAVDTRDMGISG